MGYITPMSRRPELCSRVLLPLVLAAPLALPAHAQKGSEDQEIVDKQKLEAAQGGLSPDEVKALGAEQDAQAAEAARAALSGDSEKSFRSGSAEVRAANPVVVEMTVVFLQ